MGVLERCCGQASETGTKKRWHHLDGCGMVVAGFGRGYGGGGGSIGVLMLARGKERFKEREAVLLVCGSIVLGSL